MKYICLYDTDDTQNRKYVLSAKNKIDYILSSLEKTTDQTIEVISVAETKDTRHQCGRKKQMSENVSLKLFFSFGRKNILTKLLDMVFLPVNLFIYLLKNTSRNENVLVYHSLRFCTPVAIAKKIKKFRLILELEEIYADVSGKARERERELRFVALADAYLFPSQLLDKLVNTEHKPSLIIYGTYQVEQQIGAGFGDDKIHVVYAGTFDPRKGGGAAAAAAEFLPGNYHVHILGFGSPAEVSAMKHQIGEIAQRAKAKVTYDGLLSGQEYIRFIQSCQIGLSTQNPDADFNATSFPSKILSYMANGLRVVSIRIPAVELSDIGQYLFYYDRQTPQEIARAILNINVSDDYDGKKIVGQLDEMFTGELALLLQQGKERDQRCAE